VVTIFNWNNSTPLYIYLNNDINVKYPYGNIAYYGLANDDNKHIVIGSGGFNDNRSYSGYVNILGPATTNQSSVRMRLSHDGNRGIIDTDSNGGKIYINPTNSILTKPVNGVELPIGVIEATSAGTNSSYQVTGVNYHNMTPRRGLGAVEAMLALLERLRPLMERVNAATDPVEGTGQPAMRISAIEPGPRAAAHHQARSSEMVVNRRISPGADSKAALAEIQAVAAAHTRDHPENPAAVTLERNLPPAVTPEDHPVVSGVCRAIRSVLGEVPTIAGMPAPVGISGFLVAHPIPTVLFGYGLVNLHHAIDEHIAIEDLVKTAQVYAVALMEWLGVD
jgi:acetylornithine deacetylase/succinyl-diaminopimelate desuccinylase-like protein